MIANIENATADMKAIFAVLASDVESALAHGRSDPTAFAQRTLFRTYFAQIEGLCCQFRRIALACAEQDSKLLTAEEIMLLREQKYSLNKKGVPVPAAEYNKLLPSMLFSMRCYAKVHGKSFEPDTSVNGWKAMQEFVQVRNGLEHPKSLADLELVDDQLASAVEAAKWWKATVLQLFDVCREADDYWKSRLT